MKTHYQLTVSAIHHKNEQVPLIRLTGRWLTENGFKIGRRIHVYVKPGSLMVNLILPEDEENTNPN